MPVTEERAGAALRIAIVGAGVSGVVTARVLAEAGFDVTVFEKADDVGGVWSASRSYPGISTQDDRRSYTFSDAPMPDHVDEHPSGADVRVYLEHYLAGHGLAGRVRLRTTVLTADLLDDDRWSIETDGPGGRETSEFDWLVAANGVFSTPHVPNWPGRAAFEGAGGRVLAPNAIGDGSAFDGRRVVVVGWGKTACDIAAAAATRARSVDVVARRIVWKYPKRLGSTAITFRHLVLTRLGEDVLTLPYRDGAGRLLLRRVPARVPRKAIERLLSRAIDRHLGLSALGLAPSTGLAATNSLVTEGFFEAVTDGRIAVRRDTVVAALGADGPDTWAELADGTRVATDVLVAATGYDQSVDFLSDRVVARAVTPEGDLLLHRRILADDVPHLAFIGWAHSYRSPLTSEIAAVWLAAVLLGTLVPPPAAERRAGAARFRMTHRRAEATSASQLPGVGLRDLDELLADLGAPLPRRVRLRQLLAPSDPADYAAALRTASARRLPAPITQSAERERHAWS